MAYGLPSGPASGLPQGLRTGPRAPVQKPPPHGNPNMNPSPQISSSGVSAKAEQFQDERSRIIASLFSKQDPDGKISEQYITHIRIVEDSRFPSNPPPPDSGRENKKERVILLAVRSSGRVRMHKARENANGSFSIGKTWNFEELTAIESFTSRSPRNEQEAQAFSWAGDTGFTVTLLKPYFWQTNSLPEKSFFILSLAKIYKRYTSGKLPELTGFTPTEMEQIHAYADQLPGSTQRPPSRQAGPMGAGRGRGPPSSGVDPTQRPPFQHSQSSDYPNQEAPPPMSARRSPFSSTQDLNTTQQPPDSLRAGSLRQAPSREHMRPYPSQTPPPNRLTPQSSISDLPLNREQTPDSLRAINSRRGGPFQAPTDRPDSRDSNKTNTNGLGISAGFAASRKLNGESQPRYQNNGSSESLPQAPAPIPERKRPPLPSPEQSRYSPEVDRSAMPKPLSTVRSPSRGGDTTSPPIEPPLKSPQRYAVGSSQLPPISGTTLKDSPNIAPIEQGATNEEKKEAPMPDEANEEARPGLGRMFGANKKSAKELISKAATAYSTFKPRAGGAAAKLFQPEASSNEPDGITGVVPAPNLKKTKTADSVVSDGSIQVTPTSAIAGKKSLPDLSVNGPPPPPKDEKLPVSSLSAKVSRSISEKAQKMSDLQIRAAELQQKSKAAEEEAARRKLRRTPQQVKYLERLGIDTSTLEGKGLEYEVLLEEFWPQNQWHVKTVESLQAEVRREVSKVQTGSWFDHIALHDEDRNAAIKLVDSAIEECEQLEKLLTIYSVELGSLSDDIAYIEAQGQGLQVQTSNQKLLMSELQDLLDTVNIKPQQLDAIYTANAISIEGLESTERAVLSLYKALTLTDPTIKQASSSPEQPHDAARLSQMRALQERRQDYLNASDTFLKRFKNYMNVIYGQAMMEIQAASKNDPAATSETTISVDNVNAGRLVLWKYCPLILYAKSLDRSAWLEIIKMYQTQIKTVYSTGITAKIQSTKRLARGSPGDEQDLLFTSEAQADSITASARKLTVKRSQTLAKTLRAASGEKSSRLASSQTGSVLPCEAVEHALNEITPLILSEQMFIVDFFHATTTETLDFADAVQASLPENRKGPLDLGRKPYEPDEKMTQFLTDTMTDLFSFLPQELEALVNWALTIGPLQGIGVLHAIHVKMATIDDGFYFRALHALSTRLTNDWTRFLNTQVRAIEETKVKVNKRKGVLHFMRIFPPFATHVENMLPLANTDIGEVRTLVDQGYQQIIKAMFDSLRAIAKESPAASQHTSSNDPEDKEALNYHILLIENMNHYVEHVEERGDSVLEGGKRKAVSELDEHLFLYVDAVIRRPLGKVIDFTDSLASALDASTPVVNNPNLSPNAYRKLTSSYDAKDLRRGVDALRKRVEKHFGESGVDEQGQTDAGNHSLVLKVLAACEDRFIKEVERMKDVSGKAYSEEAPSSLAWVGRDDVIKWFKGGR